MTETRVEARNGANNEIAALLLNPLAFQIQVGPRGQSLSLLVLEEWG